MKYLLAFLVRAEKRKEKSIRNLQHEIWPNKFHIYVKNTVLLVCTWRHGGHVGGQEQKHFSPLGSKLYFHVNSSSKYSFALTPNMAALSRGCKPRIPQATLDGLDISTVPRGLICLALLRTPPD